MITDARKKTNVKKTAVNTNVNGKIVCVPVAVNMCINCIFKDLYLLFYYRFWISSRAQEKAPMVVSITIQLSWYYNED